jgi:hypothetical protein
MPRIIISFLLILFTLASIPGGSLAAANPAAFNSSAQSSAPKKQRKPGRYRGPVKAATAPAGASARCRDGAYSFSQHRQGTCSHHGGVAQWL